MTSDLSSILEEAVSFLHEALGSNLWSCCLYGSAVRGNAVDGKSDINLLIILSRSDLAAHEAIAALLQKRRSVHPFVLEKRGFKRSVHAFAAKFSSIKRTCRVLHGADPFVDVDIPSGLERFLCEQALRNLRLRLVYAFVTRQQADRDFQQFVLRGVTPLFLRLSEMARLGGAELAAPFDERIPVLENQFALDGSVLRELLALRHNASLVSDKNLTHWHESLLSVLDVAIEWIEANWSPATPSM